MEMTSQHFHTIPTSCAILHVSSCEQRVVEGSVVGSAGSACWCVWGVGYVVGAWLQCTMYLLYWAWQMWSVSPACRNCWVHAQAVLGLYGIYSMCSIWSVWYVGVYVMSWNVIAAEHGRYGSMEDCEASNTEYLVHLVHMNRLSASLVPRLSVGGERESLVSTVCACA